MSVVSGGFRPWSLRLHSSTTFICRNSFSTISSSSPSSSNSSCNSNLKTTEKKQKVIVISGPTGAGKSRLALELAKRINGEIISADSVQVYRGLDVGSAKPSPSERKEVPHHLLDILHPSEEYSVGQFYEDARQATRDILNKGHVPIITGGTGLYLRWFVYGKPDVPKASRDITSQVYAELERYQSNWDWDAAVKLVVEAGDPDASSFPTNNWYRLRRSLEIIKASGSPPSAFQLPYDSFKEQLELAAPDDCSNTGRMQESQLKDLDYDFNCFFLSSPRLDLYRSIDLREEEARMKIYSVSTKHYFAFGALVSEELSYKLKELPNVRWVLPDSYFDVKNKDYGGEPFINGEAVPYDPKYHEEWVRNNAKAQERNRRNDRPRNADRSRNFDRRNQGNQPRNAGPGGPGGNMGGPGGNMAGPPNHPGGPPPNRPPNNAGYGQNMPPNNAGYGQNMPPNNAGYAQNMPPSNAGYGQNMPPQNNPNRGMPPPNYGGPGNSGYGPPNQNPKMGNQNYPPQSNMGGQPGGYQPQDVPGSLGEMCPTISNVFVDNLRC